MGSRFYSSARACEKYNGEWSSMPCLVKEPPSLGCDSAFSSRITRALMDSLGPEWRLKLPPIPVVPVSAQKRWNSLPSENHKETAKNKSKETTKSRGESL